MSKARRHEKAPVAATTEALDNEFNYQEENVMTNNSTAASNVIPFDFRGHNVRAVIVDGEPWFVASDVCRILSVANTSQAMQALDDDERSMFNIGRQGMANTVNESGLYTLILRSRDAVNKGSKPHAFRKWVTSEVLPAIRKYGRYEDSAGKLTDLVNSVIGSSGLVVLDRVIDQKAAAVDKGLRRSFKLTMKSRLRGRFNVSRTELIPADSLADACNFVAAYALEGEWLGKQESGVMTPEDLYRVYVLTCHFKALYDIFKDYRMYDALKALGSRAGIEMIDHFKDGHHQAFILLQNYGEAMDAYQREKGLNQYCGRVVA